MELDPIQKLGQVVPEFEFFLIKPESKGSNFGRTWLKPVPKESSYKFLNVRTGRPEVLSKGRTVQQHGYTLDRALDMGHFGIQV
jgi:hypothetical protein